MAIDERALGVAVSRLDCDKPGWTKKLIEDYLAAVPPDPRIAELENKLKGDFHELAEIVSANCVLAKGAIQHLSRIADLEAQNAGLEEDNARSREISTVNEICIVELQLEIMRLKPKIANKDVLGWLQGHACHQGNDSCAQAAINMITELEAQNARLIERARKRRDSADATAKLAAKGCDYRLETQWKLVSSELSRLLGEALASTGPDPKGQADEL